MASDGECLRVYQAVIDARTLLAEVSSSEHRSRLAAVCILTKKFSTVSLNKKIFNNYRTLW